MFLSYFSFLITYEFYSRMGFLISYTVTFLLVLEALRLVYTDANKREVEKMLDAYTQSRSEYSRLRDQTSKVTIDHLEKKHQPQTPPRHPSNAAATPESEKTLVNEARRKRAQSSASQQHPTSSAPQAQARAQTPTPTRRLRKRSDTQTSTSSTEPRKLERRHREVSPASSAGSKASSRHASPTAVRRVRDKEAQVLSSSLHRLLKQRG